MDQPSGLALFCDDIREEIGGKKTYVGVYGRDIVINGTFPAVLPLFAISVRYIEPLSLPKASISIRVIASYEGEDADEEIARFEIPDDHPVSELSSNDIASGKLTVRNYLVEMRLVPFQLKGEGAIRVRAYARGAETKLGMIWIRKPEMGMESSLGET